MKLTEHCHQLLLPYLKNSKIAVDATFGNGNDILFLAKNLAKEAQIFGFDIQEQAFMKTTELLHQAQVTNCKLFLAGHENIKAILELEKVSEIDLVMFNLGYLPQGDKSITTTETKTILALSQSLEMLSQNGLLSLMIYPGHPEGIVESESINTWLINLPKNYQCIKMENYPIKANSPYLILITRRN